MRERTETGSLRLELICISHSGTTLVINLYYHFNDSVDLIIFARRFAFVAMTSWMTPMQLPMGGGCNHSRRMDSGCGSGETVDVRPKSAW